MTIFVVFLASTQNPWCLAWAGQEFEFPSLNQEDLPVVGNNLPQNDSDIPDWVKTVTWEQALDFASSQITKLGGKDIFYWRNPGEIFFGKAESPTLNRKLTTWRIKNKLTKLKNCELAYSETSEVLDSRDGKILARINSQTTLTLSELSLEKMNPMPFMAAPEGVNPNVISDSLNRITVALVPHPAFSKIQLKRTTQTFVNNQNDFNIPSDTTTEDDQVLLVFELNAINWVQVQRTARALQVAAQLCGAN